MTILSEVCERIGENHRSYSDLNLEAYRPGMHHDLTWQSPSLQYLQNTSALTSIDFLAGLLSGVLGSTTAECGAIPMPTFSLVFKASLSKH